MDAARHLRRQRAQMKGVVRLLRSLVELDLHAVELNYLRPLAYLRGTGLRRVGQVQAVQAAEDAETLAQRARAGLRDARLAEVVAHLRERVRRRGDAPDDQRQRGHEIDEPRKERAALQEVVMALDQRDRGLEPGQRFDLPVALRREPVPQPRARGKPVGGVGFADDECVGHEAKCYLAWFLSRGFGL